MYGVDFVGHPGLRHMYLPDRVRGEPAAQGLPARRPPGQAVAGHRGRRADAHRRGRGAPRTHRPTQQREASHDRRDRSPEAAVHRRQGRRRPGERRARDRGHDPQHRPAAPRHPRHAAHRRPPRRRAGHRGRADRRLHAPGLREARRGPHLPADHHAGEPHRLAGQLRQRGAVHPRRRAAHGDRGAASCPVDPHAAVRDVPARQPDPVPRRHGRAARCGHPGLLRLPRPRVRARPDRGGHRRSVPPQLRPHRRPEGRPAQGLARRHQVRHGQGPRLLRRDRGPAHGRRDLRRPHPGHRRHPRRRRPAVRPVGRERPGLGHRLGPAPRQQHRARLPRARLEGLDPPRRRLVRPLLGASAGGPRGHQDDRPALRRPAVRADHGQGAPHHQGARRRGLRRHREPARRDGLLRRVQG